MVGFNYKIFCVIPVDGVFNWCKSPLPGVKKKSNRFFFRDNEATMLGINEYQTVNTPDNTIFSLPLLKSAAVSYE